MATGVARRSGLIRELQLLSFAHLLLRHPFSHQAHTTTNQPADLAGCLYTVIRCYYMKKLWIALIIVLSLILGVALAFHAPRVGSIAFDGILHALFIFLFIFSLIKFFNLIRSKKLNTVALLKYVGLALLAFFMSYGFYCYAITVFVDDWPVQFT